MYWRVLYVYYRRNNNRIFIAKIIFSPLDHIIIAQNRISTAQNSIFY